MVQLQEIWPQLKGWGYQLLAISPDTPEKARETRERHHLEYDVLSDPGLAAARAFGIAFQAGADRQLPVPAVFLVDTGNVIQFEYVHPDYSVRLHSDILLAAARVMVEK